MTPSSPTKPQVVLIILDGWGYREDATHNAVAAAHTPNFDKYFANYPHTLLEASGLAVGLPEGQMGNSEVGHTTIGAGTTVDTDLVRIKKAIDNGEYANNPTFQKLFDHVRTNSSTLHVMGLLSDGGVHSHMDHLFAFLDAAKSAGMTKIAVHVFTDGRDVAPQSAAKYLKQLEDKLETLGVGFIATIAGRFYAMDRDNNFDRLAKAEQALYECQGHVCAIKPSDFVENLYTDGKLDEHLEPIVTTDAERIDANDAVFFFNFRADRARMITKKLLEKSATQNILVATQTSYGGEFENAVAFPTVNIETTLAREVSLAGLTQAHLAETEKFPHATYFLNGGVEKPYDGETHILLDSRKDVPTHDLAPEMRAEAIADKAIEEVEKGTDFIFINFANADMVGHTANVPAIISAVEKTDKEFGRVVEALLKNGGAAQVGGRPVYALVTADHGNAELNVDPETGKKHTAHTLNLVPFMYINNAGAPSDALRKKGGLADITPTILQLFSINKPSGMSGNSLIG